MTPSIQQEAILKAVKETEDNLIIESVAGSGKTTTLEMIVKAIPDNKNVLVLAFSKQIEQSLQARGFAENVTVKTFHALGYQMIRNTKSRVVINDKKTENIFKYQVLGYDNKAGFKNRDDKRIFFEHKETICDLVSHIKNRGLMGEDEILGNIPEISHTYGIDIPDSETPGMEDADFINNTVVEVWNASLQSPCTIDFDDMIYLPLVDDLMFPMYDVILVDEAQDLNRAQRMFLRKLLGGSIHTEEEHISPVLPWIPPQGRIIVVGDSHQAIYGFRGADLTSMEKFRNEFSCKEMSLSVSYRCSKAVIADAKKLVSTIECCDTANAGCTLEIDKKIMLDTVKQGAAILCRFNAPLVDIAIHLWKQEKKLLLTNLQLGKQLKDLLQQMEKQDVPFTQAGLDQFINGRLEYLSMRGKKYKAQMFQQQADCLLVLKSWCDSYVEARDTIDNIFQQSTGTGQIVLSTIHKAKGLEWDVVYLLDDANTRMTSDWHFQEELNLQYVAITRAKETLYYVITDKKESKPIEQKPVELPKVHKNNVIEQIIKQEKLTVEQQIKKIFGR